MAAPTNRCPFKNNAGTGITCEATDCMAYDSSEETCKILQAIQGKIQYKDGGIDVTTLTANINN